MKPLRQAARRALPVLFLAATLAASTAFAQVPPMRLDDGQARGAMHGEHAPGAQPGMMPPPHGPGAAPPQPPLPPWLRAVVLTEAQQDKVFALQHAAAPALRDAMKAARKAHDALRALATTADYDDGRARVLAESEAKALAEIGYRHARIEHEIHALLTPEQRQQADVVRRVPLGR